MRIGEVHQADQIVYPRGGNHELFYVAKVASLCLWIGNSYLYLCKPV